jgi:cystathionine gamma-lyase
MGLLRCSSDADGRRDNFEQAVAALEHAKYALAFASGSATTATIFQSLALGSHVISVSDVYGGTHRYFTKVALAHGVDVTFTKSIELDIEQLIRPEETKLIWIESPSNPTLSLVDIRAVATVAHRHGIMVVVDNTFLSPYIQNPLDHGADIVVHSVTKYINGHSVGTRRRHLRSEAKLTCPRMSSWAWRPSTRNRSKRASLSSKTPSAPSRPRSTAGLRTAA